MRWSRRNSLGILKLKPATRKVSRAARAGMNNPLFNYNPVNAWSRHRLDTRIRALEEAARPDSKKPGVREFLLWGVQLLTLVGVYVNLSEARRQARIYEHRHATNIPEEKDILSPKKIAKDKANLSYDLINELHSHGYYEEAEKNAEGLLSQPVESNKKENTSELLAVRFLLIREKVYLYRDPKEIIASIKQLNQQISSLKDNSKFKIFLKGYLWAEVKYLKNASKLEKLELEERSLIEELDKFSESHFISKIIELNKLSEKDSSPNKDESIDDEEESYLKEMLYDCRSNGFNEVQTLHAISFIYRMCGSNETDNDTTRKKQLKFIRYLQELSSEVPKNELFKALVGQSLLIDVTFARECLNVGRLEEAQNYAYKTYKMSSKLFSKFPPLLSFSFSILGRALVYAQPFSSFFSNPRLDEGIDYLEKSISLFRARDDITGGDFRAANLALADACLKKYMNSKRDFIKAALFSSPEREDLLRRALSYAEISDSLKYKTPSSDQNFLLNAQTYFTKVVCKLLLKLDDEIDQDMEDFRTNISKLLGSPDDLVPEKISKDTFLEESCKLWDEYYKKVNINTHPYLTNFIRPIIDELTPELSNLYFLSMSQFE